MTSKDEKDLRQFLADWREIKRSALFATIMMVLTIGGIFIWSLSQ